MSAPISGQITFGTTGDITVPLPFIPSFIVFDTGGKTGINEVTNARTGAGFASPAYQWATASLTNASGYFSRVYPGTYSFAVLDGTVGNPIVRGKVKTWAANCVFTIPDASTQFPVFMTVYP